MLGNATQPVGQRLASLDILRGFDLFLLVFLQPVLVSLGACVDSINSTMKCGRDSVFGIW